MKKKIIIQMIAMCLIIVLAITSVGVENVSAFWNQDSKNDRRDFAQVTVRLMKCYHKEKNDPEYSKHYDSNGNHLFNSDAISQDEKEWKADSENNRNKTVDIKHLTISPRINDNLTAGTELVDTNKYIYEYEMSYTESEQVDYAVIIQPEITHYSDSERPSDVEEQHVRMYWVGTYENSMSNLYDAASTERVDATSSVTVGKPDGEISYFDFEWLCHPSVESLKSQQTWETIGSSDAFQNNRSFVMTQKYGENGQQFLFMFEGTKTVKAGSGTGEMYDITNGKYDYIKNLTDEQQKAMDKKYGYTASASADADYNHKNDTSDGIPAGYGSHIYAIVGLVFYRTVSFDANGGSMQEGSVRDMQVYSGSSKGKLIPWYGNLDKSRWYSGIDVSSPQASTPYGTASVKAPSRAGYIFTGWYDTTNGGTLLYDTDGNAVKGTKYFDSNGCWIYKGNVTAYANWEYVGNYTVRYDKGASDTFIPVPADQHVTVGNSAVLSETNLIGSSYTVNYMTCTNNGSARTTNVNSETGYFEFAGWNISGIIYQPGDVYQGSGLLKDAVVNASAVYSDYTYALPSAGSANYTFEGWYENYDADTETFSGYVGKAKDEYTLRTAAESYARTLYAKWVPMDVTLNFDYRLPDAATKSRLVYILSGADEKKRTLPYMSEIGTLPAPSLTGYRLSDWSWFRDITVPVDESEKYAKTNGDTAYAVWEPLTYSIKYDYNGGTVSRENPSRAEYYDVLTITAPALDGALFGGWTITGMDSSPHLIDGTKTTDGTVSGAGTGKSSSEMVGLNGSEGTVLFTAQWAYASYNIVYDFNGGAAYPGGSYPAEASVHEYFNVSTPENGSLIFKGWTITGMDDGEHDAAGNRTTGTTASGAGADKAAGTAVPFSNLRYSSGTVKFTAAWETNERRLTFTADTGMMTGDSIQDGWTVRFIKFGSKNFISKNAYDVNWGTDVPSAEKTGYKFDGFYTEPVGGTLVFNGGASGSIADRLEAGLYRADNGTWVGPSLILYAHFTPLEFNITFRSNGGTWVSDGTFGDRTLGVIYDSEDNNSVWGSSDIERTGYISSGWNTEADGTGYMVYDADGYNTAEGGYWSEDYRKDD